MAMNEKEEPIINFITEDKNKLKAMIYKKYAFAEDTVVKIDLE